MATLYALVFINLKTRQVVVDAVEHPDRRWAANQAVRFVEQVRHDSSLPSPLIVLRDRDDRYGSPFDGALAGRGVAVLKLKPRTPARFDQVTRPLLTRTAIQSARYGEARQEEPPHTQSE